MEPLFVWLEATSLSTWLRESPSLWAFPFVLILHTVGLAFFVGTNVAWDVRVLGFSLGIPLEALRRYFLVMWAGFWINAFSGVLLLIAYPTKALTNPLFYAKLALIAFGVVLAFRIRREVNGLAARADAASDGKDARGGIARVLDRRHLRRSPARIHVHASDGGLPVLDQLLHAVEAYLRHTPQGEFLRTARWGWPIFESLHFLGMSLLLGTVGVFDLRLLGFARRIPDCCAAPADSDWHLGLLHQPRDRYLLHLRHARSIPVQQGVLLEGDVHHDCWRQRDDLLRANVPAIAGDAAGRRRLRWRRVWRAECRCSRGLASCPLDGC